MLTDLPERLHAFFLPQVEQLGMAERPMAFGGGAVLGEELGDGYLWVAALGDGCLLSVHDFTLREDFLLREFPSESYCLSLMSSSVARTAPVGMGARARSRNVVTLYQDGAESRFVLPGGVRCWATTLCFLPEYFEHAGRLTGADPDALREALVAAEPNGLPGEVATCLGQLRPVADRGGQAALAYGAKALEALSLVVGARGLGERAARGGQAGAERGYGRALAQARRDEELVGRAMALMAEDLGRPLTLARLARELYVSKTTLCEAFRRARGMGVAECLAALRMERAEELLVGSDLSIAEVASQVGYRHQSSFCNAFKRSRGVAPSRLRG